MIAETKKAVASTTAIRNELHKESYLKTAPLSSLKIKIGQSLFRLNENEKSNCQELETMLRNYIDLKLDEVKI
jgi:hypothetical protein